MSGEPTKVTVKPVLKMIQAQAAGDAEAAKAAALEIAKELDENNQDELAQYIYAQYRLIPTFEVTD